MGPTSAPVVGNNVLAPLAILLESVLVVPAGLPVLAGLTSRHPWVIIWVPALADFTSLLPIVPCAEVPAPRASRLARLGGPSVWSSLRFSPLLSSGYFGEVDWITLNSLSPFGLEAAVMTLVRQGVVRVKASQPNGVNVMQGGHVVSTIVIVILHDCRPTLDLLFDACLLVGLAFGLLSSLGVHGKGGLGFSRETSAQAIVYVLYVVYN